MAELELTLFGGFQLRADGEPAAPIPSRTARSLFARLVLDRGTRHPRERLAAEFWPDLPAARARRRLSHALWQIQDSLGELPGGWDHLRTTADSIAVDAASPCRIDVEEFERRLDRCKVRPGERPSDPDELPRLEHAVELYRGDFLAGHYDDWVLTEQQRLAHRYLDALTALVALARGSGQYAEALVYARRLTHQDPLREDAHREVMRLCTLLGRTSDALRQYERCREVLAEELGTEPAAATDQLYRRILAERDRATGAPAPPTRRSFPQRLPLAGRDAERAEGVAVIEEALAGNGGLVLLEADAGHGKSRMLAELVDDARWRGCEVLHTVCRGPEVAGPYAAVRQLLEPVLTPLRVEQLRHRVEPVWLAVVGQLLPGVAQALPPGQRAVAPLRSAEAAQRLRQGLARTVAALAGLDPLVVVVDDLQWADEASLEVLAEVAAEAEGHGLALLLGYRGDEARHRPGVWETVRDLDRRIRPVRLVLGPLPAEAIATLARAAGVSRGPASGLAERLHRETGGHPLFVVETLRTLLDDLDTEDGVGDLDRLPMPATIRELVLDRLDGLATDQRAVLDVAAIGGRGSALELLVAASELPRAAVAEAAVALVRRGLLAELDDGFDLRHEQIRRVVLDALTASGRRALHRRVGSVLERERPDAVDQLAHHFRQAGDVRRAVHYLREAGRAAAALHAYAAAADYLTQAVDAQQRRPVGLAARFELLAELDDVLDVLGERARQLALVDELLGLADGDPGREAEVLRRRALLAGQLGDHEAAARDARRAVALAETGHDQSALATARFALARVLVWAGERRAALPLLVRAVRADGLPAGLAIEIRVTLASVLREVRRYRSAALELDAALLAARRHGEVREEALALGVLGTLRMETGEVEAATELYGQAIDRCRSLGFRRGEGINLVNLANVHYVRGHVGDALVAYEQAAEVFADLRDRRGEAIVRLNLGVVAHDVLGDDARASEQVRAAAAYFDGSGDTVFEAPCREAQAAIALRAGDLDAAQRHVRAGLELPGLDDNVRGQVQLRTRAAEVCLARGERAGAVAHVEDALALVARHDLAPHRPELLALRGRIELANGDLEAALTATSEAVAGLHEGAERPHLVRLAHHDVLRATGDVPGAAAAAREAADELAHLLRGLTGAARERAEAVPEHRRILAAAARVPRERAVIEVAAADAPRGRTLRPAELVEVEVVLRTDAAHDDPVAHRRAVLQAVVEQIGAQGGAATTVELAALLAVSEATVRRDLRAIRAAGHEVPTRGTRAG